MNDPSQRPASRAPAPPAARGFVDYYRCPPEMAPFHIAGSASSRPGFFRFGAPLCYGTLAEGQPADSPAGKLFDASATVRASAGNISLPFDPTEAAENLRRERYVATGDSERQLRKLYYSVRPLLPLQVRTALQRLVVRRRRSAVFPAWPVDDSVDQIFESMMQLAISAAGGHEVPFIWFWPEGRQSALIVTHDVEEAQGAAHCETLMDIDESFGVPAAFQVIPESRYGGVEQLVSRLRARGFEANLHDLDHDGRLYEDRQLFNRRAGKINAYARQYGMHGFRAGAMHRNQEWFDALEFDYDMSVPTVSHLEPQKGGCCTVMPYFIGNLLELPLTTVQDHGLFYILREGSIDLWKRQVESILARHGLISFIIHPDYIVLPREHALYLELLDYIRRLHAERNVWLALPGDINSWWRQRRGMTLVRDGQAWRIVGNGSERARLAYARVENGRLAYRVAGATPSNLAATVSGSRQDSSGYEIPGR